MVQTITTPIINDLGAAYPDGMGLENSTNMSPPAGGMLAIDGATIGGTTPEPVNASTISATGAAAIGGNATVSGYILESVANGLTAAGTTRADALQLAKQRNILATVASGTGVILPVGVVGMRITIFNNGAHAAQVYASGSETIDTVAGSTGVVLTNALRCEYFFDATNTWLSAQLGALSA